MDFFVRLKLFLGTMRVLIVFIIIVSVCKCEKGNRTEDSKNFTCTSIDKVEALELLMENNHILLNWKQPKHNGTCSIFYVINVYNEYDERIYSTRTTNTEHVIAFNFVGCITYHFTVLPASEKIEGAVTQLNGTFPKDVKAPTCEIQVVKEESVILICTFNNTEDNLCDATSFSIKCKPQDASQANVHQNVSLMGNKNVTQVVLKNLSEFTNYTCATAINDVPGEELMFQTKEGIPGPPVLNKINFVTNTSITITWSPPSHLPGVLQTYNVEVIEKQPLYFVPEYCNLTARKHHGGEIDASQLQYIATDLLPSYKYEVFVTAKIKDHGAASDKEQIQTHGGIPEEPKDVHFEVVSIEDKNQLDVSWTFPCMANGEITSFKIDLTGYPNADYHIGEKNYAKTEYTINDTSIYKTSFVNLEPAFNYTITLKSVTKDDLESNAVIRQFNTPGSLPEAPVIDEVVNVTSTSFTVVWLEPPRKNGILDGYYIYLYTSKSNSHLFVGCSNDLNLNVFQFVAPNQTTFTFTNALPGFNYTVTLHASSEGKNGSSVTFYVETLDSEPEEVRNLNVAFINRHQEYYSVSLMINFKPPCNFNGKFKYISLHLNGHRLNKKSHFIIQNMSFLMPEYNSQMDAWAQYEYQLTVVVVTQNYTKSTTKNFVAPSGVPLLTNYHMQSPIPISSSKAKFNFSKHLFDDTYGDIVHYAIIIGQCSNEEKPTFGYWDGNEDTWPVITDDTNNNGMQPYALTPKFWNPFEGINTSECTFMIQDPTLHPNVWYSVKVRGFTKHGYRDSSALIFKLPEDFDISALIFGIIFGILGTVILLGTVFFLWRKRTRWAKKKESIKSISLNPIPISIKGFSQYYSDLSNDAEKLKQEYQLLVSRSNEITSSCLQGLLLQNKKKNRYTNVIAYDHSRVKLKDEEDDSDYINASYIKGYSGNVEYIATQGPLEHTVIDFWKMVIQENSCLIVMVAQFVEQNKDKCFKYFPNNHENIELDDGVAIRCCTELDFKTYIVRTLLVQKDLEQWTITHLQFTDWPDFGCPTGTQMMLEFCRLMRDYADKRESPIILHCSAGIGRTGTLIALDILLQTIGENKDIDIFNTVLSLRKDRKNMVQTEKQYLYIHNCISDAIEQPVPIKSSVTEEEPIYENLEDIKKEQNGLNVKESQF